MKLQLPLEIRIFEEFTLYFPITAKNSLKNRIFPLGKVFAIFGTRRTVRLHFDCLRGVLDYAVEAGYLRENPIDRMKPRDRPQIKLKEPDFLSADEARDFLEALDKDKFLGETWKAYFALLLFVGVRRGEGLALTWADYDAGRQELTISKSVTLTGNPGAETAVKDTKTGKARQSTDCEN